MQLFPRALPLFSLIGLTILAACATDSEPPRNNGVNDVRRACEVRSAWTRAGTETCINCMAAAPSPKCQCESFKEFGGFCEIQEVERHAEPTCTSLLDDCAHTCSKLDCNCLEGCYAQAARCKQLAGARDGCVTAVCAQYCE